MPNSIQHAQHNTLVTDYIDHAIAENHILLKTNDVLIPPNAKLLLMT